MDIIQNILSEKRASMRIKSKSIIMVAMCNVEKAEEIFDAINLCRTIDPEVIDDVLKKLEDVNEYKQILNKPNEPAVTTPEIPRPVIDVVKRKIPVPEQNHSIKHTKFGNGQLSKYIFFLNYPFQCRVCGFRFAGDVHGKNFLGLHLDEHSRRERLLMDAKSISQEYFLTFDQFISKVNRLEFTEIKKEEQFIIAQNAFCEICKGKIDVMWNDEKDNWVLVDCVLMNEGEERFCHRKCII